MSYIIVLGNEKGGTGKSTLSMHLAVNLLRMGCKVGTIDIDARQGTLSRYVENRKNYIEKMEFNLPQTQHIRLYRSEAENVKDAQNEDTQAFENAVSELSKNDFLVIDTPGSDTFLSRLAHSHADTVITPLNDSFVDLDMLVRLDFIKNDILKPSIYAEMIWEQKKEKAIRNKGSIDWIVVRNRLSNIQAKNKLEMERILNLLCKRIGFRQAAGFGERVIFRELFLKGLTLLDLEDTGQKLSLSHVTARQELRNLIEMINLPMDSIQKEEKPLEADMRYDVLIVDDEKDIQSAVAGILNDEGYTTRCFGTGRDALISFHQKRPHLVIIDVWLGDPIYDNLRLLELLRKEDPSIPVLVMSGHGTIETAVKAIRMGAYDFLEKPFQSEKLILLAQRAIENSNLKKENLELKASSYYNNLLGDTTVINQLRQSIEKVAITNCRVLITGPSGSGKELVARKIHASSKRHEGPFIILNCALLSPETLEKEIFGIEEKHLDGSITTTPGVLEKADNGTLFLDEIGDMSLATQTKFVRILQDQNVTRLNSQKSFKVDVRILASTAKDIQNEIEQQKFREDLFYRLSVIPLHVPPLDEYKDDLPQLIEYYMEKVSIKLGIPKKELSPDALVALQSYDWPGNVRQLINLIEWSLIMSNGKEKNFITSKALPPEILKSTSHYLSWDKTGEILKLPLKDARESFEKHYLEAQIHRFSGNISQTAQFIEMERSALHRKLKSLGIMEERAVKLKILRS